MTAQNPSGGTDSETTRRRLLSGTAGVAVSALAGCLSSGGSGAGGTTTPETTSQECFESGAPKETEGTLPVPVKGDPESDVTVSVYEDFACSHCREYVSEVVPKIEDEYISSKEIRYERYDFPLPISKQSYLAANAARSVQARAGDEAFWIYEKQLYEDQKSLGASLYRRVGDELCLDGQAIRDDAKNRNYRKTIKSNRQHGEENDVRATPTIFVNGTETKNSFEDIESKIEDAL